MEKDQQRLEVGSGSHTSPAATPSPAPPRDSVPVPARSEPRSAEPPRDSPRRYLRTPRRSVRRTRGYGCGAASAPFYKRVRTAELHKA